MGRAGSKASPLTNDELGAIFEGVKAGGSPPEARRRLPGRNRVTVARAHNVAAEFERRRPLALDDETAQEIAEASRYSATISYVQHVFLVWKTWKEASDKAKDKQLPST